jgi:hypothetical protein
MDTVNGRGRSNSSPVSKHKAKSRYNKKSGHLIFLGLSFKNSQYKILLLYDKYPYKSKYAGKSTSWKEGFAGEENWKETSDYKG